MSPAVRSGKSRGPRRSDYGESPPNLHSYPQNVSIWPIQLLDPSPLPRTANRATKKDLRYVDVKQVDFEDVSTYFNFDFVSSWLLTQGEEVPDGHATSTAKRKPPNSWSSSPPTKRMRTSPGWREKRSTTLIDTYCVFRVNAREVDDSNVILHLKSLLQHAGSELDLTSSDLDFRVVAPEPSRPTYSVIGHTLLLYEGRTLIASLPILSERTVDARSAKLTNSSWLSSADLLQSKESICTDLQFTFCSPPIGTPDALITAGSLFVKLRIQVHAPLSDALAAPLASGQVLDMAKLARFAENSAETNVFISESSVDTNFIYQNLRPAKLDVPDNIQPSDLTATLLPFQKRSTAFLLGREGWQLDSSGNLMQSAAIMAHDGPTPLGLWWKCIGETPQGSLYYNWIEARFITDPQLSMSSNLKGAMLAEEMGLGKTLEVISLILLNPDKEVCVRPTYYNRALELDVQPTKTTLIVAPETLRNQWIAELQQHAPTLLVYSYASRVKAEADVPHGTTWEHFAHRFDVMVISYATLSKELSTAKSEKHRSRRQERKYERPRSPLVKLHFRRVVMDEVQMVGNSSAAETASMIARDSSIAVSGTPVKKVDDLKASFRFLRVPGYLASPKEWDAIFHPLLAPELVRVLRVIATRHTKAQVDLSLPLQVRNVVPIDFTSIEAAFYDDVWKAALREVGYSNDESQASEQQLDFTKMRDHLLLLRQACTNPQIVVQFRGGTVGTRNLLRGIDEVLELMIASSKADLSSQKYNWYERRILKAILSLYLKDENRRILAAAQFADLRKEISQDIDRAEEELRQARVSGPLYKFTPEELHLENTEESRRRRIGLTAVDLQDEDQLLLLGQGSEDWQKLLNDAAYREKRKQRSVHSTTLKSVLRNLLTRLHRLLQFTGNLYFQRGEYLDQEDDAKVEGDTLDGHLNALQHSASQRTNSDGNPVKIETVGDSEGKPKKAMSDERQKLKDLEDAAYADSEKVRQRLLTESREEVEAAVLKLDRDQNPPAFSELRVDKTLFDEGGGVSSRDACLDMASNCDLLNEHSRTMLKWRDSIIARLRRPVNRDINLERDDDDQYQDHLDTQAEAEVLLEMYRLLHSERDKILKGAVAIGATNKPLLYKELEDAIRKMRQKRLLGLEEEGEEEEELARVQELQLTHFQKLDEERHAVSLNRSSHSIADVQDRLRAIRDSSTREEELTLARQAFLETRRIVTEQVKLLERFRNEEKTLLTPLFNLRSKYFKEIQALSDTVSDPIFTNLQQSLAAVQREEDSYFVKVQDMERRLRYLLHLQKVQSFDSMDDETKRCNICTDTIETGILTNQCGHVCCEKCWKAWQAQGHRTCVLCQTRVLPTEVHRIVYRSTDREATIRPFEQHQTIGGLTANQPLNIQYNEIDGMLSARLERVATSGRFGSKIDQVTKHLKHIIDHTDEKSLVFSSFKRGLDVVAQALTANGIRFVRLGSGKPANIAVEAFRNDVPVMLLHSEVQSSGLNLVAARHIHILEPLLNSTLELQAIGRVHRIGQTKETNVWCYFAKETVEERVLALAAYKGQSLYLKGQHTSLGATTRSDEMNKTSIESASKQDARNWAGTSTTLRGDHTTSKLELQAVYFAQNLHKLRSEVPRPPIKHVKPGPGQSLINGEGVVHDTATSDAQSSTTRPDEDEEKARMRSARLALFNSK